MNYFARTIICSFAIPALAYAAAGDGCDGVLQYAARNYTHDDFRTSLASTVYQNECNGETFKHSAGGSLSLNIPIGDLPIGFGAAGSNDIEKMSNFCKTYYSLLNRSDTSIRTANTVVESSTRAWVQCKQLAASSVDFRPQIAKTQFTIGVQRQSGATLDVGGISVTPKGRATCTYTVAAVFGGNAVNADERTKVSLPDDRQMIFQCARVGFTEPGGKISYPAVDISIATTRGTLLLPISSDAELPVQWASQIGARLDSLQQKLDAKHQESGDIRFEVDGAHGSGTRGKQHAYQKFNRPFSSPPALTANIAEVDFENGRNHRVNFSIDSVDRDGFYYTFITWSDTMLWDSHASWMAVGD